MNPAEIMIILEGMETTAYDCTAGYRTVGIGFNMESGDAQDIWTRLGIEEDFTAIYDKEAELSEESAHILFNDFWPKCEASARRRAEQVGVDYDSLPEWHQFILADIVYNIGNCNGWTAVFKATEPEAVLMEARRRPKEVMDSRVAKIGHYFGFIDDVDHAKSIGLEFTKYVA